MQCSSDQLQHVEEVSAYSLRHQTRVLNAFDELEMMQEMTAQHNVHVTANITASFSITMVTHQVGVPEGEVADLVHQGDDQGSREQRQIGAAADLTLQKRNYLKLP
jgi:hypothetical protein